VTSDFTHIEILLVEDTPTDAEMTIRALRRRGLANRLHWVKDGSEALDFLYCRGEFINRDNRHPKLVLLDLKMPKLDGLDVLKDMMQHEELKTVPVVMLTSSAEDRDIVDSYALGCNSYIVKPMDIDEFDRVVSDIGLYWMLVNKVPQD
jgi:CheY-like chemotaxis protein